MAGDQRDVTVHPPAARAGGGQRYEVGVADEAEAADSIERKVWRGVNANRLTLLGIVAAIALTVAFGVNDVTWACRVAIGVGTFVGVAIACRLTFSSKRARNAVMGFAHWMLHEEPIEDKQEKRA